MQVVRFHQSKRPVRYEDDLYDLFTYHFDGSAIGNRVTFRKRRCDGWIEMKAIKGDGRSPKFQNFHTQWWTHDEAANVDFQALAQSWADPRPRAAALNRQVCQRATCTAEGAHRAARADARRVRLSRHVG